MKRPRFSLFSLKADFWASATASITSPTNQIATPAIAQSPKPGVPFRPSRYETGSMITATEIACSSQKRAKRSGLSRISSKR